jgi:hypothetical protein
MAKLTSVNGMDDRTSNAQRRCRVTRVSERRTHEAAEVQRPRGAASGGRLADSRTNRGSAETDPREITHDDENHARLGVGGGATAFVPQLPHCRRDLAWLAGSIQDAHLPLAIPGWLIVPPPFIGLFVLGSITPPADTLSFTVPAPALVPATIDAFTFLVQPIVVNGADAVAGAPSAFTLVR